MTEAELQGGANRRKVMSSSIFGGDPQPPSYPKPPSHRPTPQSNTPMVFNQQPQVELPSQREFVPQRRMESSIPFRDITYRPNLQPINPIPSAPIVLEPYNIEPELIHERPKIEISPVHFEQPSTTQLHQFSESIRKSTIQMQENRV